MIESVFLAQIDSARHDVEHIWSFLGRALYSAAKLVTVGEKQSYMERRCMGMGAPPPLPPRALPPYIMKCLFRSWCVENKSIIGLGCWIK